MRSCHGYDISFLLATSAEKRQRYCQCQSAAEIREILDGIARRCDELGVLLLEMLVVDNCCHVRGNVTQAMPQICVLLDVYHFMMRLDGHLMFY